MLDKGKQNYFKYDMEDLLATAGVAIEFHNSLIQTLWSKGTREGIDDAREFLKEKIAEGIVDHDTASEIRRIMDSCTTRR